MDDNWSDAERLAARVLASGSDEALRDLLAELDRTLPPRGRSHRAGPTGRATGRRRKAPGGLRRALSRFRSAGRAGLGQTVADGLVVVTALAAIWVGAHPLVRSASIADASPVISEALLSVRLPGTGAAPTGEDLVAITSAERPVSRNQPLTLVARDLEASVGRYRSVARMHAERKLSCQGLRDSYRSVERWWTRYSVSRGRTYGDRLPEGLVRWDEALYDAVRDVDRDFTRSGCNRP